MQRSLPVGCTLFSTRSNCLRNASAIVGGLAVQLSTGIDTCEDVGPGLYGLKRWISGGWSGVKESQGTSAREGGRYA